MKGRRLIAGCGCQVCHDAERSSVPQNQTRSPHIRFNSIRPSTSLRQLFIITSSLRKRKLKLRAQPKDDNPDGNLVGLSERRKHQISTTSTPLTGDLSPPSVPQPLAKNQHRHNHAEPSSSSPPPSEPTTSSPVAAYAALSLEKKPLGSNSPGFATTAVSDNTRLGGGRTILSSLTSGNSRSASPAKRRRAEMEVGNDGDGDMEDVKTVSSDLLEADGTGSEQPANKKLSKLAQETGNTREESVDMVSDDGSYTFSNQAYRSPRSGTSSSTSMTGASRNSTAPAIPISPRDTVPPIEEQISRIRELSEVPLSEGFKGYVISNQWLEEAQQRGLNSHKPDKECLGDLQPPLSNLDLVSPIDGAMADLKDEKGDKFFPLKPGYTTGREIEILPKEAWDQIVKWHGQAEGSPEIVRYCHNTNTGVGSENFIFEVYPPIFTLMKLPDGVVNAKSLREKDLLPAKVVASRSEGYQRFLKRAKEAASIGADCRVRVWRILGPIKDSSQHAGMITPAQSRSNSPAPTAVETDLGNKLIIDINTFLALQTGSQRELVDLKDETNNENYNGHANLDLAGLGQEGVLVLEEQIGGPAGGEWVSDSAANKASNYGLKDNLLAVVKPRSTANSGRTSPAPSGIQTRGRTQRNGRAKGTVGLGNLGNTCYMNSALQCVKSVKELTHYFLENKFRAELNPDNPLGHNGDVAKAYAGLLQELFLKNASSFSPRHFKQVIGRYGASFSGYGQQDSQEFLLFLLDGLQEDLNRIHKKPYIEKPDSTDEMVHDEAALSQFANRCWEIYKARNDSVITDLFAGMYKSTVTCPICEKVSIIFDPFNNLTLQLPIENVWSRTIAFFPLNLPAVDIDVEIDRNASFYQLKEYIGQKLSVDPKRLVVAEVYRSRFFKMYDDKVTVGEERLQAADQVTVFELDDVPTNYPSPKKKSPVRSMLSIHDDEDDDLPEGESPLADRMLVPVFQRRVKESHSRFDQKDVRVLFSNPSYIILTREEAKDEDLILKKVLATVVPMTTRDILQDGNTSDAEDSDAVLINTDTDSSSDSKVHAHSVESEEGIVDISMKDSDDDAVTPHKSYPPPPKVKKSLPKMLQADQYLIPEARTLFEVKYFKATEMVPTGWTTFQDETRKLPSLASRIPRRSAKKGKRGENPKEKLKRHIANGGSEDSSSDEDLDDPPPVIHPNSTQSSDTSDEDDDGLPQVVKPVARAINSGFSRFNRSTPHNGEGLITYARKGKTSVGHNQEDSEPETVQTQERISLVRLGEALVLDWSVESYNALFGDTDGGEGFRGAPVFNRKRPLLPDPDLDHKRALRHSRRKRGVTLGDCLEEFGKEEILSENDAWYCPRCKEHRRASKKFELWKSPDILVIHLKRFSAQGRLRDKLDVHVDFPIEGLDLSSRVAVHEEGEGLMYDLFAVDNHYGGLGGGHYTAFAQNFNDGNWYEYNDSMASRQGNLNAIVSRAAYLLFYRRRSTKPLGGPFFEAFLDEEVSEPADSGFQMQSRNESPASQAGEGERLDSSSQNGLSSAYHPVAGVVHQVGGGGLQAETMAAATAAGPLKITKGEAKPGGIDADADDDLPGYSELDPSDTPLDSMELDDLEKPYASPSFDSLPKTFNASTWEGFGVLTREEDEQERVRRQHIAKLGADETGSQLSSTGAASVDDDDDRSMKSAGSLGGWDSFPNRGTPEEGSILELDDEVPLLEAEDENGDLDLQHAENAPRIKIHGPAPRHGGLASDDEEQPVAEVRLDDGE